MQNKIKKEMQRQELADYLEEMATALRKGNFETGNCRWSIPDTLQAKISHKEKKAALTPKSNGAGRLWSNTSKRTGKPSFPGEIHGKLSKSGWTAALK